MGTGVSALMRTTTESGDIGTADQAFLEPKQSLSHLRFGNASAYAESGLLVDRPYDHSARQSRASRSSWSTRRDCTGTRPSPSWNLSRKSGCATPEIAPLLAAADTPAAP